MSPPENAIRAKSKADERLATIDVTDLWNLKNLRALVYQMSVNFAR